jgi:signal transduction histidine kinase
VKPLFYLPIQRRAMAVLGLLLFVLTILVGMIWRNLQRFETVHAYVFYSHKIQELAFDVQKVLTDTLSNPAHTDQAGLKRLAEQVRALSSDGRHLEVETPHHLVTVADRLAQLRLQAPSSGEALAGLTRAVVEMSELQDAETDARETVLDGINRDMRLELQLALVTLTALSILAAYLLKRRIIAPLQDLRTLLARIARGDFTPIYTEHLDPLLLPVFDSYNDMAKHLAELEQTKQRYAQALESDMRAATQTLLEQQRALALAQRLAVVGELAAGVAHELRNPLAGIQLSCSNLRNEVVDPDQAERLDLIITELKRTTRLVNGLLDHSKHTPVAPTRFNLTALVRELVALTRYQIPAHVRLDYDAGDDLDCRLPADHIRQALLNLILNATEALDGKPGSITIQARRQGEMLDVKVTDTGPGFSPEVLRDGIRMFATGRQQGMGLGLAIVQRFVREVGGQVRLSNLEPRGACVSLQLPCEIR